jgi:Na+-transporting methylmalonyl-CoA/oxaloacetate decarboxylase gamma subunit
MQKRKEEDLRTQKNSRNSVGCWSLGLGMIFLTIVLLFFFEWLGSEQTEKWIEKAVPIPEKAIEPEKSEPIKDKDKE